MYYLSKNYFDIFKTFFIFIFLSTVLLLFGIFFPNETFTMEPNTIIDYFVNKKYIGPDPYGHYMDPTNISITPAILANIDIIWPFQNDSYATSAPYEKDWYAKNDLQITQPSANKKNL